MANIEINSLVDFKCWVRTELLKQGTSQRALAHRMDVPETRISEAVSGKPSGKKYLIPMIEMLGGNAEDFKAILTESTHPNPRRKGGQKQMKLPI